MPTYLTRTLRANGWFLIPFLIIWCGALIFASLHTKAETHIIINRFHSPFFDCFFKYITELGGSIPWIIIGLLLLYKVKISLFLTASQLVATLITTPLKHIFHVARPSVLLSEMGIDFHTVAGVALHVKNSFPSGHTSSAFALFFAIAVLCKKPWQKALCLFLALLAGFSRIYLSQHFLQDVLAGSIIGIVAVLAISYWFTEKKWCEQNTLYYITKAVNNGKKDK